MKNILILSIFLFSQFVLAQQSAMELIERSINYHDPDNRWEKWSPELNFNVLYPGKPDGKRFVEYNNRKKTFNFRAQYESGDLVYQVDKKGVAKALWNDSEDIPKEMAEKYRISKERALMYRNYYTYLYGMPMKLKDEGTIVHPKVSRVTFFGKEYTKIKVSYDKEVGQDIWYFYFDPQTSALKAYQFFKDEAKNDGEYILFEEEILKDGIKVPKDRKWYYNKDDKYLATDSLY